MNGTSQKGDGMDNQKAGNKSDIETCLSSNNGIDADLVNENGTQNHDESTVGCGEFLLGNIKEHYQR